MTSDFLQTPPEPRETGTDLSQSPQTEPVNRPVYPDDKGLNAFPDTIDQILELNPRTFAGSTSSLLLSSIVHTLQSQLREANRKIDKLQNSLDLSREKLSSREVKIGILQTLLGNASTMSFATKVMDTLGGGLLGIGFAAYDKSSPFGVVMIVIGAFLTISSWVISHKKKPSDSETL